MRSSGDAGSHCGSRPHWDIRHAHLFIYYYSISILLILFNMTSPHTPRKKTPKTTRREGDTVRRTAFFKVVDSRGLKSLLLVYKEENIPSRTGEYWLKQRREAPEIAYRRVGAFRTGRPFKIPDQKLDQILNPKNEVRDQCYEHQIEIFQLGCSVRCL